MEDTLQTGNDDGARGRDLLAAERERNRLAGARERAKRLKVMIFDVDGVMTDGTLYYSERGEELKAFNTQDGHGVKMLKQSGVEVALITARSSRAVELRAANLGIAHLYQGVEDKRDAYAALLAQLGLAAEQSGYMGDDLLDLPLITRCGFAATVAAAPAALRSRSHFVARAGGGHGAVREVCEFILDAQGALAHAIEAHLK
jgi:3-deoxy-D-manno-octulosonate 8-phosphate phosphatase (KDO 8-P phosphatase)